MLIRFVKLQKTGAIALALYASAQPAFAQSSCFTSIDSYFATLPAFSSPTLQSIVNSLREQSPLNLQYVKEGKFSATDIPRFEREIQRFSNGSREALANHIRQGGELNEATCNPPPSSQAQEWAATRIRVAFDTWAINTIRCAAGESNFAPIPQFCPFAAQTNAPTPSPAQRDDPKVFGRSARGG